MNLYFNICSYKKPTDGRFFVRIRRNVLLVLMPFIPTIAFAQEVPLQTVDLRSAIAQTIDMHPELKSFAIQAKMYSGYAQQAGVQSRPQIGFTIEDALGTGEHSGFKSAQSTLSISWLLDGGLVQSKIKAAKQYGSTVALEREVKALDLAAQTARYFIQVLVNNERLKLAQFSLKQANNSFEAISKRVKAGKSSLVDKLKSQAEVANRELIVEDLTHEVDASKYQLFAQWGEQIKGVNQNNRHKKSMIVGSLLSLPSVTNFDSLFTKLRQTP